MNQNCTHLAIINGHVIDPDNGIDQLANVYISDGKIAAIGEAPAGFTAEQTIDANGQLVLPGLVELRAHLGEPGYERRGTIASETQAAVAGGITSLCCTADGDPVTDNTAVVKLIRLRSAADSVAKVYPLGALTLEHKGELLSEMRALKEAGCVAISTSRHCDANSLVTRRALEYAASHDLTLFIHAQDSTLSAQGCVHEGPVSARLGLKGIPETAETIAVSSYLMLAELTQARLHFCGLTTANALEMVAQAKAKGLAVSADVNIHNLHLSEMDVGLFNSHCHVLPPLRSQRDMQALQKGLATDAVDAISSDHLPLDADAKLAPFADTEAGISGLETLLPLALRIAENGPMSRSAMVAKLTSEPAKIAGLDAGTLSIGSAADICLFDPEAYWLVEPSQLQSQGKNTPFASWELKGKVTTTLVDGLPVFQA